ncbi:hypothetical protein [Streptomyces sp. NBC_00996]|uniref:hypothetical protein n=1 Tax=Streptomyces sp. NBC_00996 TaxID=2903710 RepID=UPI00386CCBE0|nr:hypothetical protein OG390_26675 [Streptomyces sp. NBC_00996]
MRHHFGPADPGRGPVGRRQAPTGQPREGNHSGWNDNSNRNDSGWSDDSDRNDSSGYGDLCDDPGRSSSGSGTWSFSVFGSFGRGLNGSSSDSWDWVPGGSR